jgi:aryl-alcohol dehydrogenase-like predicted oxidoreductase
VSSQIRIGDFTVNRLGFGAMRVLGDPNIWGPPKDPANAKKVLRRAYELGANFFDTAESYGPHTDEMIIAEAMHPYPKDLVIATKCGLVRPSPGRWDEDARPEKLKKDLEGSLKRLKLECLHLWQLHAPDPKVPLEESIGVMADAQRAGKVRHIGVSNFDVSELERARKVAPIVSVQNQYNLGNRESEPVLNHCEKLGIAFLPWYPLGAGSALRHARVRKLARRLGATAAQATLAWLLAHSPVMLPIPGTGSIAHLEENMGAAKLQLSKADLAALD